MNVKPKSGFVLFRLSVVIPSCIAIAIFLVMLFVLTLTERSEDALVENSTANLLNEAVVRSRDIERYFHVLRNSLKPTMLLNEKEEISEIEKTWLHRSPEYPPPRFVGVWVSQGPGTTIYRVDGNSDNVPALEDKLRGSAVLESLRTLNDEVMAGSAEPVTGMLSAKSEYAFAGRRIEVLKSDFGRLKMSPVVPGQREPDVADADSDRMDITLILGMDWKGVEEALYYMPGTITVVTDWQGNRMLQSAQPFDFQSINQILDDNIVPVSRAPTGSEAAASAAEAFRNSQKKQLRNFSGETYEITGPPISDLLEKLGKLQGKKNLSFWVMKVENPPDVPDTKLAKDVKPLIELADSERGKQAGLLIPYSIRTFVEHEGSQVPVFHVFAVSSFDKGVIDQAQLILDQAGFKTQSPIAHKSFHGRIARIEYQYQFSHPHAKKNATTNAMAAELLPLRYYFFSGDEGLRASARNRLFSEVVIWVPLVLLAAVAFLMTYFGLSRPLARLTNVSKAIKEGNYVRAEELPDHRRDEIGDLARAFVSMTEGIKSREERSAALFNQAGDAILVANVSGEVIEANPAAISVFGDWDFSHHTIADVVVQGIPPLAIDSQSVGPDLESAGVSESVREGKGKRATGEEFPIEFSRKSIYVAGEKLYLYVCRDVTARIRQKEEREQHIREVDHLNDELKSVNQQLEERVRQRTHDLHERSLQLQEANDKLADQTKQKDMFLAKVSHELRSPLVPILHYAEELLEESDIPESQERSLRIIHKQADHLGRLINDILDYEKIIVGTMGIKSSPFSLVTLVQQMLEVDFGRQAAAKGNHFRAQFDPDLDEIESDPDRIKQVLKNLLSNACKFTHEGEIGVITQFDRALDRFSLTVTNPTAMGAEAKAKLFKPFATELSKGNELGTGLGLVISKELCQLMGGRIEFRSEEGEGTRFTISLPRILPKELITAQTHHSAGHRSFRRKPGGGAVPTANATPTSGKANPVDSALKEPHGNRILVIDDDPDVRQLLRSFLLRHGYEVFEAAGGEQGLAMAKSSSPTIITLDAKMPGLNGWETLSQLKEDPETANIPVIMLTILDDKGARGFALGAADYLTKPIDWTKLLASIQQLRPHCRRLLVVDDDLDCRQLTEKNLEKQGWEVETASNGREALGKMDSFKPEMIVLDLMMPEIDGFEFLRILRNTPSWSTIPVVVLTARDLNNEDLRHLDGKVDGVLQKGLTWGELQTVLQDLLASRLVMPNVKARASEQEENSATGETR